MDSEVWIQKYGFRSMDSIFCVELDRTAIVKRLTTRHLQGFLKRLVWARALLWSLEETLFWLTIFFEDLLRATVFSSSRSQYFPNFSSELVCTSDSEGLHESLNVSKRVSKRVS